MLVGVAQKLTDLLVTSGEGTLLLSLSLSSGFRMFAQQGPFCAKNELDMEILWHHNGLGVCEHNYCLMRRGVWRCGGF